MEFALVVQTIPITYLVTRYCLTFVTDNIVDNIEDVQDLVDLRTFCVKRLGNRRWALSYALITSVILSVLAISIFSFFNHGFIGLGRSIDVWIFAFCAPGLALYFILVLVQLPSQFGNYHYKVYELNPAQSEVIVHISTLFTRPFLGIAIYLALCTAIASLFSEFLSIVLILIVVFWIPLVIQFINSQNALNKIIASAKWKTLTKIQERIRRYQDDTQFDAPGNIESLNRLMDLYERVYHTSSFKITARSTLELVNQLLLPLLAFLISSFDKVVQLFR